MTSRYVVGLAVSLILAATAVAAPNMQEGMWEITARMEIEGMAMQMPPATNRSCLTADTMVPQSQMPGQQCRIVRSSVQGDTVTWVMECRGPSGEMDGNGQATYRGTTMDGVVNMVTKSGGERMKMVARLAGRRVGPCG